jgi:hypothetical protein
MQEIEENDATAAELSHEIECCAKTHTKCDSTLDDVQVLLVHQKQLTGDKASQKRFFKQSLMKFQGQ